MYFGTYADTQYDSDRVREGERETESLPYIKIKYIRVLSPNIALQTHKM